mmetsp:Transcript_66395/g.155622  ORF Transcript_66395/g.155622 Transcript_66395/m.155622 type:complete len:191 (-) Transcript_66395:4-576(-)
MEIHVQIPEGAKPGSTFQAQANGQVFTVLVPDGTKPGQTIRVPMQAAPTPAVPVWQPPRTEPPPYLQFVWVAGGAFTAGILSWVGVCANNVNPPQTAREINASKYVAPAAACYLGAFLLYIAMFAVMVAANAWAFLGLAGLALMIMYTTVCAFFFVRQYLSDSALMMSQLANQRPVDTSGAVVMGQRAEA